MAIALVKKTPNSTSPSVGGAGTSTTALAFASNVTIGNLIVVVLARWNIYNSAGALASTNVFDRQRT